IWRNISQSQYWNKNRWILPIHRPSQTHWVLAIIIIPERKILVFDSFGAKYEDWRSDLDDILELVTRLGQIARENGKQVVEQDGQWTAHPISTSRVQRNGFDCGVWVLAVVAAVLRGYHMPAISHDDIAQFR
ncbi:hypothetical protein F5887DRAFT_832660, partial [Amanita rubescens]